MKYVGSKNKVAKYLIPIIMDHYRRGNRYNYIEPFVGGANIIDKIPINNKLKIGADSNKYLISCLDKLSKGWLPKEKFTEEEYNHIKNNKDLYDPEVVGYVGFSLSYGGKFFGGWRRDSIGKRDYVNESYRSILKQAINLQGINFINSDYRNLHIPHNSLVYCDPPYQNTLKYLNHDVDYIEFWDWVRELSKVNTVLISEYNAPEDFISIWSKTKYNTLAKDTGSKYATENLFIIKKIT